MSVGGTFRETDGSFGGERLEGRPGRLVRDPGCFAAERRRGCRSGRDGGGSAASASAAASAGEAIPCGCFENAEAAYYGHCGDTTVMIKVDYHHGRPSMYTCVGPWTLTYLGSDDDVSNAFHIGLC
ncbi:DUF6355 family natural product biosynthesis protein [Saccharothrix xinjiangensis]|uniref:DUF6355 family natural product biosynthesis protein n=1 Tax=Saccharothrix xinjiangensis TaxID=204798 RepID=A0ABV9XPX0_9PSEU